MWLVGLAIIALSLLVFLSRHEIRQAIHLIAASRWQLLLLIPFLQLAAFYGKAGYYHDFLHSLKYHVPLAKLYKLTFAVSFVNQVSPAAGVTGASLFSYQLRPKVPTGKTTLIEYSRYLITHISFSLLLAAGVVAVYLDGSLSGVPVLILAAVVTTGVVVNLLFFFAMAHKRFFNRLVFGGQRLIDRITNRFRASNEPLIGHERAQVLITEFRGGYEFMIHERKHLFKPFLHTLLSNTMDVTSLYLIFVALGSVVNPGKVIISYATANFVGAVSVIPGDVGIYELTMVAALSGIGVPVALALSATLLFRVINKTISLPLGFYWYTELIRHPLRSHAVRLE